MKLLEINNTHDFSTVFSLAADASCHDRQLETWSLALTQSPAGGLTTGRGGQAQRVLTVYCAFSLFEEILDG